MIFTDNGVAPVQKADHIKYMPSANSGRLETDLMDLALLSQCNDLVMTVTSSTGYIAAAWGGLAPVRPHLLTKASPSKAHMHATCGCTCIMLSSRGSPLDLVLALAHMTVLRCDTLRPMHIAYVRQEL